MRKPELDTVTRSQLERLRATAKTVGKAWSGSRLGYQANVYYQNFEKPPRGAIFSQMWGFDDCMINPTNGDWVEFEVEFVLEHIKKSAGALGPNSLDIPSEILKYLQTVKDDLIDTVSLVKLRFGKQSRLEELLKSAKAVECYTALDYWNSLYGKVSAQTRDERALEGGLRKPAHLWVECCVMSVFTAYEACDKLTDIKERISQFISNLESIMPKESPKKPCIFIGHGRDNTWREVSMFILKRLCLDYSEFNSAATVGLTTVERLSEMLDGASAAIVVLTAEDEQADGRKQPRMNVVHEVGLFQGRLGFKKVVVLLEDGCEEFSNIHGLTQIRFKKGEVSGVFEKIREFCEREGLVK